jgi:hypothetical protein
MEDGVVSGRLIIKDLAANPSNEVRTRYLSAQWLRTSWMQTTFRWWTDLLQCKQSLLLDSQNQTSVSKPRKQLEQGSI